MQTTDAKDDATSRAARHGTRAPAAPSKPQLSIALGMATEAGPNESNDDCLGARTPEGPELATKGVAVAIADGVSAAEAGKQAAEICVQGFLNDYYDAPDAWSARAAGAKVATAINRWLYSLSHGSGRDGRGHLSTFTAVVFKGESAHVFHVGDTRLYRWRRGDFEQMTRDHSFNLRAGGAGLSRAMGMDTAVELDVRSFEIEVGDRYLLTTDGVHGALEERILRDAVSNASGQALGQLDAACQGLVKSALAAGSLDNGSAILIEVLEIALGSSEEHLLGKRRLPFPPDLAPGMILDGYEIEREIQATSRSQVYLVTERDTGRSLVMKTPSVNFEDDSAYIERFMMEAWIGKKLKSDRLMAGIAPSRAQTFLYTLFEYIEGPTLEQWMRQRPRPDIRKIVEHGREILHGLRAMHRQEMLHQDVKPSNVIIHPQRGAIVIDYGSAYVAGIQEIAASLDRERALGTLGYSAPEYFLGKRPTRQSDLFSLGVVLYEALTGELPYGPGYERCQTVRDFSMLEYRPATQFNSHVPVWLDGALRRAVQINPQLRYESYSEFEYDLEHPNPQFLGGDARPFIERNPKLFWRIVAAALAVSQVATLAWLWLR